MRKFRAVYKSILIIYQTVCKKRLKGFSRYTVVCYKMPWLKSDLDKAKALSIVSVNALHAQLWVIDTIVSVINRSN
jgi:hypothetical protein